MRNSGRRETRLGKALGWVARVCLVFLAAMFGVPVFVLIWHFVITPITLFFEQDYRPWSESAADLAATWDRTYVVEHSPRVQSLVNRLHGGDSAGCAAFNQQLHQEKGFTVPANSYCKIRLDTACTCPTGQVWVEIQMTKGDHAGRIGWICRDAIGLTVAPL